MKLSDIQIQFLLKFFPDTCAGAKGIARQLLEKGKCIVAGTNNIWVGGVGNFINIKPADGAFECTQYTLDLEAFLASGCFKDEAQHELLAVQREINERMKVAMDISMLLKYAKK